MIWEHLESHHPELAGCDLSVIPLGEGWLVQVQGPPKERLLYMVNRYGFVNEMGRTRTSAKTAPANSSVMSRTPVELTTVQIDLTESVRL